MFFEERPMYYSPEDIPRKIARTAVVSAADPKQVYDVFTIFLGLDHSFGSNGPSLIYETMVFGDGDGNMDLKCTRYSTKEEAIKGHRETIVLVSATMNDPIVMDAE